MTSNMKDFFVGMFVFITLLVLKIGASTIYPALFTVTNVNLVLYGCIGVIFISSIYALYQKRKARQPPKIFGPPSAPPIGYRWTSDGDWELFSPDEDKFNAKADIGLYSDTYHQLASVTANLGNEEIDHLKEYEACQEELLLILNISCISSSPFEIDVLYRVETLYGRIAPYATIAGLTLLSIALLLHSVKHGDNGK